MPDDTTDEINIFDKKKGVKYNREAEHKTHDLHNSFRNHINKRFPYNFKVRVNKRLDNMQFR